jgi:hypothetical protein
VNPAGAATAPPLESGWLAGTPAGDTVLRQFVHNQIELNELVAALRGGRTERSQDAAFAHAGRVTPFLNQTVLLRPLLGRRDELLDRIEAFHGDEPALLLSVWPTPDLRARGWTLMGHPTFVVRGPGPLPPGGAPTAAVERVASVDALRRFEQVLLEGYPAEPSADGAPTFPDGLVGSPLSLRVALLDDRAVATGASHVAHGVVNLCLAATLPDARRRGAWAALVRHRVADDPTVPAVAFTSDLSRPGFERMGFLPVTRFTLWSLGGSG